MFSILNSQPAPAAADSPNSDEEIEEAVDSDIQPPIQDCFIVKLNRTLQEKMGVIKEFLTILILVLILIEFLYKHFSKDERDLHESFFRIYIYIARICIRRSNFNRASREFK